MPNSKDVKYECGCPVWDASCDRCDLHGAPQVRVPGSFTPQDFTNRQAFNRKQDERYHAKITGIKIDMAREQLNHDRMVIRNYVIGGCALAFVFTVLLIWGVSSPPPPESFPYGPTPAAQSAKREHGVVSGWTIEFDEGYSGGPGAIETAIHVGEGWDTILSWDGPSGSRGALNYDGTITFTSRDGSNELRGLLIQSLEADSGHR